MMNATELGGWLGWPPRKSAMKDTHNHIQRSSASQSSGKISTSRDQRGSSSNGSIRYSGDILTDDTLEPSTIELKKGQATGPSFHIDVPTTSDSENYEFLPGHFSAKRVLNRLQDSHDKPFTVKLQSEETQTLTLKALLKLRNGRSALQTFEDLEMETQRRNAPRRRPSGFVDPALLEFSDEDEPKQSRRRQLHNGMLPRATSDTSSAADIESEASSEDEPAFSPEDDASANSNESETTGRRSGRLANARRLGFRSTAIQQSSGESSDDLPPFNKTKPRKRKAPPTRQSSRPKRLILRVSDSPSATPPARRSQRTRLIPRRDMRERQEDEISENEEERTGPKVVATKEVFPYLSENNAFRRQHRQVCDVCDSQGDHAAKGPLVFCQGCTNSYHKACLGSRGSRDHLVTKAGDQHFVLQCRRCLGVAQHKDRTAPHHGNCTGCLELNIVSQPFRARLSTRQEQVQRDENGGQDPVTFVHPALLNSVPNVMFRCATCQRAWHMNHLPKRKEYQQDLEEEEELLDEISLAQKRFDEYHRAWICKDCHTEKLEIDGLVAWRPINEKSYIPGMTVDMIEEADKEYLVKWKRQSHFHTTWMPGSWLWGVSSPAMRIAFMKKEENRLPKMTTEDAVPEAYLRIDIVFDVHYSSIVSNRSLDIDHARIREVTEVYVKFKGLGYEDALWEKPPSPSDTERWTDFKTAYEDWCLLHYVHLPQRSRLLKHLSATREKNFESQLLKEKQPPIMNGGEMMDYQVEGMNWLYYQWYKGQNAILADEMGLGKTIQLIAFFATMVQDHKCWPFLVVVPNSTCPNWRREIKKWVPSLRVVTYYGSAAARKLVHDKELFPNGSQDLRAHIVVTSYESMVEDRARISLQKILWAGLVVDEGQKLKNERNLLYEALNKIKFPFKVLLTGTPLQNNARELFNLLQFLDRKIDAAKLEIEYGELTKDNLPQLHELIRPFFLRRTKAQVLKDLPPMAQIIVPVTMTSLQKRVYKSILAKNPQLMKSIFARDSVKQTEHASLNNILMQLRKTLCHPFMYSRQIEERSFDAIIAHRNLVDASSKLQLLETTLPKLQERGHRVLIFSQFLDNLDIVEDFLDGIGLQHHRLDGSINSLEKQKRIDEFNAPNSSFFAFLLSTRAGGVGINLATADTVIIMDPDFNPHQDIQALSRAHRIGQKKKVLVYQLMTRGSAEEKIMQIGKKKMALDHVLIQSMDDQEDAGKDLESILKHGAEALFDDNDKADDIKYDSASIDKLLDRSQIEDTATGEDNSAESQFSFARVWANDKTALQDNLGDADKEAAAPNLTIWDKILEDREKAAREEAAAKAQAFGRGKRRRGAVDYSTQGATEQDRLSPRKDGRDPDNSDADFQAQVSEDEDDTGTEDQDFNVRELESNSKSGARRQSPKPYQPTEKARPFKRVTVPEGTAPNFGLDGQVDYPIPSIMPPPHQCRACGELHSLGWCRLKIANVEHCGLCGMAHMGVGRTCPHLADETQVATMLSTLKESTESKDLVEQAVKYLRQVRGDLAWRRRAQEKRMQGRELESQNQHSANTPSGTYRTSYQPLPNGYVGAA